MRTTLLLSVLAMTGCATGLGVGQTRGATKQPLGFEYVATDAREGELTAVRQSGEVYRGRYEQLLIGEEERRNEALSAARPSVSGFIVDTPVVEEQLYAHELVASLKSNEGREMTCHLFLRDGARGIAGGAAGPCTIAGGEKVHVVFPPSEVLSAGPAGLTRSRG